MAFEIPLNMNSVSLVRDELNKCLDQALQYADAFLAEPSETANLDRAIQRGDRARRAQPG